MKFYRIENDKGEGVYRAERGTLASMNSTYLSFLDFTRHPAPYKDSLLVENAPHLFGDDCFGFKTFRADQFIFGFVSLEQLRMWFYDDKILEMIGKEGFVIAEYESEEVYTGHTQAVSDRTKMTLIEKTPLYECKN